jgi:hypothetical protein
MKALIAMAVLLALGATAQAKVAPLESQLVAIAADNATINSGPAGATLESNYIRAPQAPTAAGRIFPCRLQLHVFEKTRLAQSCN